MSRWVLLSGFYGEPHGTALSARDFLRSLLSCRSQVTLITPRLPRDLPECRSPLTLKYLSIGSRLLQRILSRLPSCIARAILRLRRQSLQWFLASLSPSDCVFVNGWASRHFWQSLSCRSGARKVLISRESPRHFNFVDSQISLEAQSEFLRSFDHVIFVSEILRLEWIRLAGLRLNSTHYLPNCCEEEVFDRRIDVSSRSSLREHLGLDPDGLVLLCPGSIEARKGQADLLRLAPDLCSVIPRFQIVFLGQCTSAFGHELRERVECSSWSEHFIFQSPHVYPVDWFQAADLLIFPSYAEALPRTILEAMVSRLPVLSSNVDGIPELIHHQESGYLFAPGATDDILQGILWMTADGFRHGKHVAEHAYHRYYSKFCRSLQSSRLSSILPHLIS